MNVLFVCNIAHNRSPTAARIFSDRFETKYAGIYSLQHPVTNELLAWADVIAAMEPEQKLALQQRFHKEIRNKRIIVLNIEDRYQFMDEELVKQLEQCIRSVE
jgi:predicted protein tyrosine phosphatase